MFGLSEEQQKTLNEWVKQLPDQDKPYGCIGGRLTYCFTPTTLGVIALVKDAVSDTEINLTPFEDW